MGNRDRFFAVSAVSSCGLDALDSGAVGGKMKKVEQLVCDRRLLPKPDKIHRLGKAGSKGIQEIFPLGKAQRLL